jgi:excinuclease UvrABC nuclease subunit
MNQLILSSTPLAVYTKENNVKKVEYMAYAEPGYIYTLHNEKGDVVYVGKTNNLDARLESHRAGLIEQSNDIYKRMAALTRGTDIQMGIVCACDLSNNMVESYWINKYNEYYDLCNTQLVKKPAVPVVIHEAKQKVVKERKPKGSICMHRGNSYIFKWTVDKVRQSRTFTVSKFEGKTSINGKIMYQSMPEALAAAQAFQAEISK